MKEENDTQSPHASLQALLPRLGLASPRRVTRPVFDTRQEAEKYVAFLRQQGGDAVLAPVWTIDHDALDRSDVVAWSVSPARD